MSAILLMTFFVASTEGLVAKQAAALTPAVGNGSATDGQRDAELETVGVATLRSSSIADRLDALAQSPPATQTRMKNSGMYVGGLVMSGVGGYMLGYGLSLKQETVCATSRNVIYCEEYGKNKVALITGGAGIAALGFWLAHVGGERVSVAPSLDGIRVDLNVLKWGRSETKRLNDKKRKAF